MKRWLFIFVLMNLVLIGCTKKDEIVLNKKPENKSISVTLYGVLLEDNGVNGELVGCGDSLVPVRSYELGGKEESFTRESAMKVALSTLLLLKTSELKSGQYNGAYQSNLMVNGVEINGDVANVFLTGNPSFGGMCDVPRFQMQL